MFCDRDIAPRRACRGRA